MSRKYIRQQILQDFVYPNNDVAQYDVEIVQNINNNCVDGDINSFSATTFNSTGITFSLNASYILNGAEPFNLQSGQRSVLSVHMMGAGQSYFKPWRLVKNYTGSTASTGTTIVDSFTVLPSQLGLTSFISGAYYFEFRFIGHKCVLPVCYTLNLAPPTPTPTPSHTPTGTPTPTPSSTSGPVTPTPTPTGTPTGTPTPTPTSTSGPVTPTPTPTSTPIGTVYTYVAGCTGGTILGYILGSYSSNVQFTATDTNCYVTTYTTTSPSIGSLLTVSTIGSCCPTPTPTPVPPPVGVGIYSGATFGSSSAACADTNYPNGTVYIPNGDTLSNGDTLYTNTGLTTNFVGNDNYYRLYFGSQFYAATISALGIVSNLTLCGSTPTPTPTSTLTPTPTPSGPSYNLYTADRYTCDTVSGPCTYVETIQIANPVVMVGGKFYFDNINGYILNVSGTGSGGPYLYTDCSGLGTNNCSSLCGL